MRKLNVMLTPLITDPFNCMLVTADKPDGIAKLMQSIGRRYVQYINRSYRRTGSLWEGRFKSSMVNDPAQYRWSSYRHNGLGQADERITPHPLYWALGKGEESRLAEYRGLFRNELDEAAPDDIRLALAQGQPLGSERFSEIMCAAVGVRRAQRRPGRPMAKRDQSVRVGDQSDFGF